ncbi:MAG TPA: L-threonylcarbamoyladenylate synthase, partial [Verrucomicrobiae bacterium]
TEVLATHTAALFRTAVERAVELLRAGEVVALPTETVYGLAANALDSRAVARIYEIKGRPAHNPIIVHVASSEMARRCVSQWPPLAEKLARAFWPGPLTVVLPRDRKIPDNVTACGETVGVRWPSHPFIQEVIRACDFPLAAPSANLSNQISPTNAGHVARQLDGKIPLIVDGGQSQVGLESTVLDLTATPPRLLRPGMIHEEALMAVTEKLTLGFGDSQEILKSPGQLRKHYAPKAKLIILKWRDEADLRAKLSPLAPRPSTLHLLAHTHIPSQAGFARVSVIPHDAEAFARALYAELHHCDELGAELIVVEEPPSEWRAIADRLKRASSE